MSILICAEGGTAHNGKPSAALDLAAASKEAGADVFKLQCWTERFWQPDDPNAALFERCLWDEDTWRGLAYRLDGADGTYPQVDWFASVFDLGAVELMESLGVKRYKIASRSWQDTALIDKVVSLGKPVYISTGMGDPLVSDPDASNITFVHCVSLYPCPDDKVGLDSCNFDDFGYSDHTVGSVACIAAAALGMVYIEKHLCINNDPHPDLACSLNPGAFKQMVTDIRRVEVLLG